MRRSEADFRTLIEHAPNGVFIHRRGEIVYANPACVAMLGYESAHDLLGRNPLDLVHPEDRERVRARIAQTRDKGGGPPGEVRLLHRDGRVLCTETEGVLLEWCGEPSNVVLARDLTERREMFARIAVADRMLSVGTLAAGVAHEINNPLAFVMTNLALLEGALLPSDGSRRSLGASDISAILRDARDGAARVAAIVRDLRSLARADDEAQGPSDVRKVLALSIKMAQNEIRHRSRVVQDFAPQVLHVDANESRLGQVFLNLLINAAQAIPPGHAEENEIRVRARAEGQAVVVEVEDTGAGIPAGVMGRIFDPFFTTKPVGVGTGLGLAICHGIVQRLGGEIAATSLEPRGTRFRVSLPRSTSFAATTPASAKSATRHRSRILFVDDEPSLGTSVRLLLEPQHEVVPVTRASRALELITGGNHFDVILCDLMMPEMSGIDFYGKLSQVAPEYIARVIFLTGGAFTEQAHAFLSTLANPPIEKPFSEDELRRAISRTLAAR
jgi:PAS domain S-box-containing protein